MTTAISVKGLSKRYRIGAAQTKFRYGMLRDVLVDSLTAPIRYARSLMGRSDNFKLTIGKNYIWALDDVSFDLEEGRVLGIVGRNGAGKSTLLKILSRVTEPTEGTVSVRGRVGSLLEVGTGFHPELTGRENIYINGSVLGLTTKDIDAKLDAIIDFADIGDFIDAPVQSYSSGMHVRLGFAVATALRPDVLFLDEVLAVGDAAFRAKCYERLARLRDGAAFVLVSHDSDQIARVCSQVLVLDHGCERHLGDVGEGLRIYQDLSRQPAHWSSHEQMAEGARASIERCDETVALDGSITFSLLIELTEPVPVADVRVVLWGDDGSPAFDSYTRTQGGSLRLEEGRSLIALAVGPLRLRSGRYALSIALLNRANNLHLYWGERVRTVEAHGPVTAAVPYTPAITCRSLTPASILRP